MAKQNKNISGRHMGGADSIVALGLAIATGRNIGRRVVISTRSVLYSNAVAIKAKGNFIGIKANGTGLDVSVWGE